MNTKEEEGTRTAIAITALALALALSACGGSPNQPSRTPDAEYFELTKVYIPTREEANAMFEEDADDTYSSNCDPSRPMGC